MSNLWITAMNGGEPSASGGTQAPMEIRDEGSDWVQRFETPLGDDSSDGRYLRRYAQEAPHQGVIAIAQRRTRWDHPKMGMQLPEASQWSRESRDAGKTLEHMLVQGGYPPEKAAGAFVVMHRDPHAGTSNTAADSAGHPGAALHPARWDYGTLAHEAAHHLTIHQNNLRPFDRDSNSDADTHGPDFARNYARTLDMVSDGAGDDFLRHHGAATALMGNYRARVHGLARELPPSARHEDPGQQADWEPG